MKPNSEIIDKFIKVELLEVVQKNITFYIGKMDADEFLKVYTVNPAEYDARNLTIKLSDKDSLIDEDYINIRLKEKNENFKKSNSQRTEDKKRVAEIVEFLKEDEMPIFPNSIITTCDLIDEDMRNKDDVLALSYFDEEKKLLYIPKDKKSILVIDGQHRIRGLEELFKIEKYKYEFILTFLLGFTRPDIAKIFYTVNFNQKPVNKSNLYHLMAEFNDEIDEVTFLHELVKYLNELSVSPLYNRIKMLGSTAQEKDPVQKKKMTISQACFIDALKYTLNHNGTGELRPIFHKYFIGDAKEQVKIILFVLNYFIAIKELFSDWDDPSKSIISKSVPLGALLKLINYIFIKITVEENSYEKAITTSSLKIKNKLEGIQNLDLTRYDKISSASTVKKLLEDFKGSIKYLQDCDFEELKSKFDKLSK